MFDRIPHENQEMWESRHSKDYIDQHRKSFRWQFGPFLKRLSTLDIDGRYLEIGSGPGLLAAEIASRRPNVDITAVELSPEMVRAARDEIAARGYGNRVRFISGSADDDALMEDLGRFDLVYSTFSLHHWENPVRTFRLLYRAVADGGVLLIQDLCRTGWLYVLPANNGLIRSVRAAYRPRELEAMMHEAGASRFGITTGFAGLSLWILARKDGTGGNGPGEKGTRPCRAVS